MYGSIFASYNHFANPIVTSKTPSNTSFDIEFSEPWFASYPEFDTPSKKEEEEPKEEKKDEPKTKPEERARRVASSDAVDKAMRLIAFEELGQDLDKPLPDKMLRGYQLEGEPFKTYGFGQVYNWNGTKKLQDIKPVWTEAELRDEFRKMVTHELQQVRSAGLSLSDNQLAVLARRYHFGPAAFNDLVKRIKTLGRIPTSDEYKEMALAYARSCRNWNLYGKGWTNGINREASYWS